MARTTHFMWCPRGMNLGIVSGLSALLLSTALVGGLWSKAFVPGTVRACRPAFPEGGMAWDDIPTIATGSISQFSPSCWVVGSVLLVAIAARRRGGPIRHGHRQRVLLTAKGGYTDDADMLMKAGLRNLLGVEDNMMAQKLQAACKASDDMKRCMADSELKVNLTMEELAKNQKENNKLRTQLASAIRQGEECDINSAWALAEAVSETEKVQTEQKTSALEFELAVTKADLAAATEAAATAESALVVEMAELATAKKAAAGLAMAKEALATAEFALAAEKASVADTMAKLEAELASVKAELAKTTKKAATVSAAKLTSAKEAVATMECALAAETANEADATAKLEVQLASA